MKTTDNQIGARIKNAVACVPTNAGAETVTSAAIDRLGFESCVLDVSVGAASGAPDSFTANSKVTHCDTSGGSYTDWTPDGTAASGAIAAITAASTRKRKSISLLGAKRYLKFATVVTLTGGTTPKLPIAALCVLGTAVELPAQADD